MKKKTLILTIAVLTAIFFGYLWLCYTLASPSRLPTTSSQQAHQVGLWNGNGCKNTETFYVPTKVWYITWKTWLEPGRKSGGLLAIWVYTEDGKYVDLVANVIGADTDSSAMRGKGHFYLEISSSQPWTVEVKYYE